MSEQWVILDRDGVINHDSPAYIKNPDEWHLIPGSGSAISRLNQAGFRVAVATNQSGVARGLYDLNTLQAIHAKMRHHLADFNAHIDVLYFCPHGPEAKCECRKPKPGLFKQIAENCRFDLTHVPAIGDSLRDLQAAKAVGATPILVKTGKGEQTFMQLQAAGLGDVPVYNDLDAAVKALLSAS